MTRLEDPGWRSGTEGSLLCSSRTRAPGKQYMYSISVFDGPWSMELPVIRIKGGHCCCGGENTNRGCNKYFVLAV